MLEAVNYVHDLAQPEGLRRAKLHAVLKPESTLLQPTALAWPIEPCFGCGLQ